MPTHLFTTIGSAALYLVYAAIGGKLTGHNAFFWLDEAIVGSKEKVTAYCTGFIALAAACKCLRDVTLASRASV